MKAASFIIFSTGTELSQGRSRDSNGPFIARTLLENGFHCAGICMLPDDHEVLKNEIAYYLQREDISGIILTGGLGPTADDLTVDVLSDLFSENIKEDEASLEKLKTLINTKLRRLNLDVARRQVRILEHSIPLKNETGLAPGILFETFSDNKRKKIIGAMPGYPQEMLPMFENELLPQIQSRFQSSNRERIHFYLYGVSESAFQSSFIEKRVFSESFIWGVAARNAHLKIFFESDSNSELEKLFREIREQFSEQFMEEAVTEALHELLGKNAFTVCGAESCTGGLIGKILTDTPGSSAYFKGSMVTYSNELKTKLLEVPEEIIQNEGAVSENCALYMAAGAKEKMNCDYAFAVTGIAGPDGGTMEKPVGTVFAAIKGRKKTISFRLFYPVDRERIRLNTAHTLLFRLYKMIQEEITS